MRRQSSVSLLPFSPGSLNGSGKSLLCWGISFPHLYLDPQGSVPSELGAGRYKEEKSLTDGPVVETGAILLGFTVVPTTDMVVFKITVCVFLLGIVRLTPALPHISCRQSITYLVLQHIGATLYPDSSLGAPSYGVRGLPFILSFAPFAGPSPVRSMPHPFSPFPQETIPHHPRYTDSFHRTIRFRNPPMTSSFHLIFKNTISPPLGIYVMLSPKPSQHTLLCASGSCKLFLGKHPFREEDANFPFLQFVSDFLGSMRMVGAFPVYPSPRGGERKSPLTINTLPCLGLSQGLLSPSRVLLTQAWGWSEGCGNRPSFTALDSYCQFQDIRKILTQHPHYYSQSLHDITNRYPQLSLAYTCLSPLTSFTLSFNTELPQSASHLAPCGNGEMVMRRAEVRSKQVPEIEVLVWRQES